MRGEGTLDVSKSALEFRVGATQRQITLDVAELLASLAVIADADRAAAVYRDVIVWSIRAYYDGSDDESG